VLPKQGIIFDRREILCLPIKSEFDFANVQPILSHRSTGWTSVHNDTQGKLEKIRVCSLIKSQEIFAPADRKK
jgi:hypothetical protein